MLAAGARVIHVDVMDGHFVPPITFGALIVEAVADRVHQVGGMVDAHLMIDQPERHVRDIASAGADNITVHFDATTQLHYVLGHIGEPGRSAGAAFCPGTPAASREEVAHDVLDLALCMSVNPGWGAQELIPASLDKLTRMRAALPDRVALEVDGGVHQKTVKDCVEAGAGILVTGSAVFGSPDPAAAYAEIAELAGAQ